MYYEKQNLTFGEYTQTKTKKSVCISDTLQCALLLADKKSYCYDDDVELPTSVVCQTTDQVYKYWAHKLVQHIIFTAKVFACTQQMTQVAGLCYAFRTHLYTVD